ncbi:MAG: PAS domain S-box protein [Candidatus Polarisedimenticolaceae bacterium]|nr:PAS domain S-box protein [Candidatus Polarisedimenticolaceae bacterium]
MALKKKPSSFRLARFIPLPVVSIVIGLLAGLLVWVVLDRIQSQSLNTIFMTELKSQLEQRAWENQLRFEQRMDHHRLVTHLLTEQWRMRTAKNPHISSEGKTSEETYDKNLAHWMDELRWLGHRLSPSYIVIVGDEDDIEHIYTSHESFLKISIFRRIVEDLSASDGSTLYIAPSGEPYLVVTEELEKGNQEPSGRLVLVTPIDQAFLSISQRGDDFSGTILAVLAEDGETILASSDDMRILTGSIIGQWQEDYVITARKIGALKANTPKLEIATFVPHVSMLAISERIVAFERQQRIIGALVFVGIFTLVMVLLSSWLMRILRRISNFARRALAVDQPVSKRGNKLILLEEWIRDFILVVKRTRDELRREHAVRLHDIRAINSAVLTSTTDLIISTDQHGQISEVNPRVEQAFGYSAEELTNKNLGELLVHEQDQTHFKQLLNISSTAPEMVNTVSGEEILMVRSDETFFPTEVTIIPVQLEERRLLTISFHDISKRKKAEQEIKSLARFASENPSPVLRVNSHGSIVYANAASQVLLDFWCRDIGQILPLNWHNMILAPLSHGKNRDIELVCEEKIYSLQLAPVPELAYVNIFGRDITDMRQAEQQSRQHQTELVHVCRVSTMGEMATGLAHELNQPLAAIMNFSNGCVRRIKSGAIEESALSSALEQITLQAERAGEIIRRLRNLVQKQPPERSRVDLNALVQEVASFVEYDSRKMGIDIKINLSSSPLMLKVDFVQIEQVLLNLVRNALDAMHETAQNDRELIITTRAAANNYYEVSVRDTGPGMNEETISHLFDAFFSTKQSGMGMGLPISKSIIDDHRGIITVKSVPEEGTEFVIALPDNDNQEQNR